MKFLALKEALQSWEDQRRKDSPKKTEPVAAPPLLRFGYKHKRVEGGIDRIPINSTARRVIQKAPWWAQKPMSNASVVVTQEPISNRIERPLSDKEQTSECHQHIVKDGTKAFDRSWELYQKSRDARAAMEVLSTEWKVAWLDFMDTANKRLHEFRMTRMAISAESEKLMKDFREIRKFFLEEDYENEVARLKEFVSLCERLQKLKESGFLDTVADTMLKLTK